MSSDPPTLREEHDDASDDGASSGEDFSLEQLSQAYAQVLQQQNQETGLDQSPAAGIAEGNDDENLAEEDVEEKGPQDDPPASRQQPSPEDRDAADNAACPISPASIVEALLFVGAPAGTRLTGRQIAAVMRDVSPREVKKIVKELNRQYEKNDAAYRIVESSGDYKLTLCEDLQAVQNYFFGRHRAARLNQNTIDVLAIVAYHQPLTRAEVDQLRGRSSGGVLSQLLKRDLVVLDESGDKKQKQYRTSDRFLDLFGLGSIDDLPQTSVMSDMEELSDH